MTNPQSPTVERTGLRQRATARLAALKTSRQRNALGLPEIAGLFFAMLMVLAVVIAYFSYLVPAKIYLRSATNERIQITDRVKAKSDALKTGTDKDTSMSKISTSLTDFESNFLEARSQGRVSLVEELNGYIRGNNLKNTSGPQFVSLSQLGANGKPAAATATRSGNAKWQSFYPGIGVSVTLEGQYQNLRHFIRDVEANKHFVVINSVELEKATNAESGKALAPNVDSTAVPATTGSGNNTLVSLQMDMSTYFRREATDPGDIATRSGQ